MRSNPTYILLFLLTLPIVRIFGQDEIKTKLFNITTSPSSLSLNYSSQVDKFNSHFSRDYNWRVTGITTTFEPIKTLKLSNHSKSTVYRPRLVINGKKKWHSSIHIAQESIEGAITPQDKARQIWEFVVQNRKHFYPAEPNIIQRELVKILGIYGYGLCDVAAAAVFQIGRQLGMMNSKFWRLPQHTTSELGIDDQYFYLDADIETYYLKLDNKTIANKSDISNDRYLISRTRNYGKLSSFHPVLNQEVSGLFTPIDYPQQVQSIFHPSLDYYLRAGESIVFDTKIQENVKHHVPHGEPQAPSHEIANGYFEFIPDLSIGDLASSFSNFTNVEQQPNDSSLSTKDPTKDGTLIITIESPFVIVDGLVEIQNSLSSSGEDLQVYFSKDQVNWTLITSANSAINGSHSIDLADLIRSDMIGETYSYFIKIILPGTFDSQTCKINYLKIKSIFQTNRNFLPELRRGLNTIEYSDTNAQRNLKLSITYEEVNSNIPPDRILEPLYPASGSTPIESQITFEWPVPNDPEGLHIRDYEFQLSDDPNMKYTLSPNFDVFNSSIGTHAPPFYKTPYVGLLNAGTTYYWRVRAKDDGGAWGEWSPIWHFTPNVVMQPVNIKQAKSNREILISWSQNPLGTKPKKYIIHGSNEMYGFTPSDSTIVGVTDTAFFHIPFSQRDKLFSFYRIVSVDSQSYESMASKCIPIPYLSLLTGIDSVFQNQQYSIQLYSNQSYFRTIDWNTRVWEEFDYFQPIFNVINLPSWLSFDSNSNTISGIVDSLIPKRIFYDSTYSNFVIDIGNAAPFLLNSYPISLQTDYNINHNPEIGELKDSAHPGIPYFAKIDVQDTDLQWGDYLTLQITEKPNWLQISFENNAITFNGIINTPQDFEDDIVELKVLDSKNGVAKKTFSIPIQCSSSAKIQTVDLFACSQLDSSLTLELGGNGPWEIGYSLNDKIYNLDSIESTAAEVNINVDSTTLFKLLHVSDAFCTNTDITDSITITIQEPPNVAISDLPQKVCSGSDPFLIFTTPPGGYLSGMAIDSFGNFDAQKAEIGVNRISYQFVKGLCSAIVYKDILVEKDYEISLTSNANSICLGDSAVLGFAFSGIQPFSVKFLANNDTIELSKRYNDSINYVVYPNQNSVYKILDLKNGVCGQFAPFDSVVEIEVIDDSLFLTETVSICEGTSLTLEAHVLPEALYNWETPQLANPLTAAISLNAIQLTDSGTYTVYSHAPNCVYVEKKYGVEVKPKPPKPNIISDSVYCIGSLISLSVSNSDSSLSSLHWEGPNGFKSDLPTAQLPLTSELNLGYYLVQILQNGCSGSFDSVLIENNTILSTAHINSNSPVCLGDSLFLNFEGSVGLTYHWVGPNGLSFDIPKLVFLNALDSLNGEFLCYASENGCAVEKGKTTIVVNRSKPAASITSNSPVCKENLLQVGLDTLLPYETKWSGPDGFSKNSQNFQISDSKTSQSGLYTLEIKIPGCGIFEDSTYVEIKKLPQISNLQSNSPLCAFETLVLQVDSFPEADYAWFGPLGFRDSKPTVTINKVMTHHAGYYGIELNLAGCKKQDSIEIIVYEVPPPSDTIYAQHKCQNDSFSLSINTAATGTYTWHGPSGFSSNYPTLFLDQNKNVEGSYVLEITTEEGCFQKIFEAIVFNHPPPDSVHIYQTTDNHLVSTAAINNQWFYNGIPLIGQINQTLLPDLPGIYTVEVHNEYNCKSSADFNFKITTSNLGSYPSKMEVYPNPGQQSINVLILGFDNLAGSQIDIYDIYGKLVLHNILHNTNNLPSIIQVDISTFAPGLYFIHISGKIKISGKFQKQ